MAETVNFTGAVDKDLLKRAKVVAAKNETSVNALFNAQLRYLVETFENARCVGQACGHPRTLAGRRPVDHAGLRRSARSAAPTRLAAAAG